MSVLGCPECETFAEHELVATPASEVDGATSRPDAVFECVACEATFDLFDSLDYE